MPDLIEIILTANQLEGTQAVFSTWLVTVGDSVEKEQPIAELETDKVSMEIGAAEKGVIHSLLAKSGDSIETGQCLGKIDTRFQTKVNRNKPSESKFNAKPKEPKPVSAAVTTTDTVKIKSQPAEKKLISPVVRRLLHQHDLTLDQIQGSGKGGRVSRDDILHFLKPTLAVKKTTTSSAIKTFAKTKTRTKIESKTRRVVDSNQLPVSAPLQGEMHPHSPIRKSIAQHMIRSLLQTSPHVTSVFEMDMGNIIKHQTLNKNKYLEQGVKLTFTAYFLAAMAKAVKQVPQVNAKYHENALEVFDEVNIGVGTALGDDGLVVPVIHQVQNMNLFKIAKVLNLQTQKARAGKLQPSDVKNGTLTISNYGVSGSLLATPIIINQPQVAILGVGKLEKRVIVEPVNGQDAIVIRPRCYVSLSIDHRALDAYQTNLFLTQFVRVIESWGDHNET